MKLPRLTSLLPVLLILVTPVSTNYSLRELDFGAGGGVGQSTNYSFEGILSEQGTPLSGTTYNGGLGFGFTQMAFVPLAPSFSNPANYYNRLLLIIDPSNNPSDALYAIAISSDNFTTTQYVKADQAIGDTLTFTDYQTYASWGGASGFDILGLQPGTTYQVKVKAYHGNFTESPFGPSATASTVNPSLTFDIDIANTDISTNPPYQLHIGTLLAGTVLTAADKIWLSLSSNANHGGTIHLVGQNGGLTSPSKSTTIVSNAADLASASQGFGLQGDTLTTGGSDLSFSPAFDLTADNVAAIPTLYQKLASSTNPLTNARLSLLVKAKSNQNTIASADYQELLTIVASANF